MTLIRQATLHYHDKASTKIYELDLYQVNENLYIINYIAKDTDLHSGEITTEDLPLEQAQQIFNTVIQQKTQQGYILTSDCGTSTQEARKQAVLNRLANNKPSKWKLERAIWRAGELRIKEAAPLLINLIGTDTSLRDYCIVWALGLCGSTEFIPTLLSLHSDSSDFVERITFEALLKIADAKTIANLKANIIDNLPQQTQILARTTSPEIFTQLYTEHPYYFFAVLDQVYQLQDEHIRPALLNILRTAPFQPNYFHSIRRIFKIAEYRCDAEVFANLAYRFERTPGNFDNTLVADYWNEEEEKRFVTQQRVYNDEQQQDEPILVYSYQTQQYLRRRVWRTLKTLGETGGADYIKMATAVLLEYSDSDEPPVIRSSFDKWDYYQRKVKYPWDAYADYLAFNHILYTNSNRYEFNYKAWRRRKGIKASFVESDIREEAFPELWQQHPEALLKLLMNSKSHLVRHFAVKILRDCTDFCASLNINTIMELVYSTYQVIAVFGFELALQRLNQDKPNQKLILFLTNRVLPSTDTTFFILDDSLKNKIAIIVALTTSKYTLSRKFIQTLLNVYVFHEEINKIIFESIISKLLEFTNHQKEAAQGVIDILLQHFQIQLHKLDLDVVINLLTHPILEIKEFGSLVLLNHEIRDTHEFISNSNSTLKFSLELVKLSVIQLQLRYASEFVQEELQIIVNLTIKSAPKTRNIVKQMITDLIANKPQYGVQLSLELCQVLLTQENHENLHKYLVSILEENLSDYQQYINKKTVFEMLSSTSNTVFMFATSLLKNNFISWINELTKDEVSVLIHHQHWFVENIASNLFFKNLNSFKSESIQINILVQLLQSTWISESVFKTLEAKFNVEKLAENLSTIDIVKLFRNSEQEVRGKAKEIFLKILARLSNEDDMLESVKLLESHYEDTQEFVLNIFKNQLSINHFTPAVIIKICQIKRIEVKNFSLELLTQYFNQIDNSHFKEILNSIFLLIDQINTENCAYLITLLRDNLSRWKEDINKETVFKMLSARATNIQDLGVLLLNVEYERFSHLLSTNEVTTLANHNLTTVRQVAQLIFLNIFDNIRSNEQELLTSVKWLESDWEDSRCFGAEIFTSILYIQELTPKLIIRIADSDKQEARIVGETLLNHYLQPGNPYITPHTATEFIQLLLPLSKNPSVYSHILSLLQENPQYWAPHIDKELLLQILQAKLSMVQEFAIFIVNSNLEYFSQELTTSEIIKIANHEILSVREVGRQLFSQNLANFRNNTQGILNAVQILESKWQDTRDFGFKIFTTEFSVRVFTPDVLITICDSTNQEARKLGRELLTRSNTDSDLQEYLLKFSEHPSLDMQMFVTNYLDNAANNPQYLRALVPYFNTVLSSVNRNRGAKKRILNFLETEAQKSQEAARIITEVIQRQVLTMAVGDKATAIQILLQIKKTYPHLNSPITVQNVVEERRK
ncbi:WGR domain-containing protein [Calothrix sp. NIES-4071]|nr:WGR domain-containing protein [Calothrix sp. NIES-4071]BAZ54855.1 WGR domain-containing protein [Calothrix sp. NIES-4105]